MPIYRDTNTPDPFIDPAIPWDRNHFPGDKGILHLYMPNHDADIKGTEAKEGAALPNNIYMDAMGFGMGCSCLQITFQAYNLEEARRVYDALVPVGPIMLALTAAAPMFRGYLADVDCRWDVIAGSVDDRTDEERGKKVCIALSSLLRTLADPCLSRSRTTSGSSQSQDMTVWIRTFRQISSTAQSTATTSCQ